MATALTKVIGKNIAPTYGIKNALDKELTQSIMVRHLRAVKEMIVSTSEGKDIIFGFDKNDTLTLDNLTFTSTTYSKSKSTVTLKFDTGSITFKDYTATTYNLKMADYAYKQLIWQIIRNRQILFRWFIKTPINK